MLILDLGFWSLDFIDLGFWSLDYEWLVFWILLIHFFAYHKTYLFHNLTGLCSKLVVE